MIWLVLIVTSVYAVLGQDIVPLIIEDAEDFTGYISHFNALQVRVNTVAGSKFHWRHNGHRIDENYKPAFYDPYATRLSVAVKSTIEYAGIYQFYMETPVGTIIGRNATVEFTYLGDFLTPSSTEDVREVVVGQAAFIKCPAHTRGHNFNYNWGKIAIVGGVIFIKSAPNYIVLNNGTLFFSHLKKEDVKYFNMKEARCGMEANAEDLNRFKFAHLPTQFRYVLENFTKFGPKIVTSLPNRIYVLGDTIALVCAATGNPVPIYTWKKIDSEGNEKDIVDNQDGYMFENKDPRILVIEKAQVSHSGRYRCTATIGQKSDTNEGELRYHIKPEWVLPKIASVKVSIYSSHSWQCNATSHPLPRYKWYVNGRELADSPEHRIIGGNITFPRLEKKQSGMNECFAANELDNIHQTAYLEVEAVTPTFVSNTGKTTLFVNNRGEIECHAHAAPDAKNTWQKDGVDIDTGLPNYELINNEHLVIKTVKKDDSGEYTCTARNMFGTDVKKIQVQVVGEIKFFQKPQDRNITRGERFDLTCEARGEHNLGTPIKYKWKFKGKDLPLIGSIIWSEHFFKLIFINPQVSQSGDYECIAYIEQPSYAEIKQTARVIVRGPPEAPNTVVVKGGCAGLSAKLSWNMPSNSYDPIKYFIIQLSTSFHPDDWRNDTKVLPHLSEKVFENLSPYTQYRFRVLAKNKLGTSEPSKYTRFGDCITPQRAPTICPTVHGKPGKAEELTIKWKKMELIDQNGADFKYYLQYRKLGEKDWKIHNAAYVSTEFHISKAGYYKLWEFRIQGINKVGGGPFCEGKAYSGQNAPLVAPQGFRVLEFGSVYAVLGWSPIELKRGGVDGYKLSYWQEGVSRSRRSINAQHCDKKNPCKIEIPGSRTEKKRLDGLLSYKTYTMALSGYNSGGEGPASTLKVDTTEGRPGAPEAVVATPYAKYIKLEWREPSAANGVIAGYNVSIAVGSTILKKKELGGGVMKHVFGGLEPNKKYILSVQARTKEGFGPSKTIKAKTKLLAAPKCNVWKMNLMFLVDGSGSVPPSAFKEFKRFMQLLVKKFVVGPEATHVGVLQYSSKVRTGPEFAIGEHQTMEAVQDAISKVRYHYGAYTFGGYAMRMAKELMDDYNRRDAKNVMVFLMDDGTWDKRLARKLSKTLRNSGTQIIILDLQKMKIMHDIADKGLEFTTEKLEENVEEVATEICT